MKMMPSCREVARALSSDELSELPLRRRLLMRWHLFMCRDCLRYSRQIAAIGRAARALGLDRTPEAGIEEIDPERLELLEATILDALVGGAKRRDPTSDSPAND